MRDRKEIQEAARGGGELGGPKPVELQLEVLLDIRDLLLKNNRTTREEK